MKRKNYELDWTKMGIDTPLEASKTPLETILDDQQLYRAFSNFDESEGVLKRKWGRYIWGRWGIDLSSDGIKDSITGI